MLDEPPYKQGDYFHCGEGVAYSKILIMSKDTCLIKKGPYAGIIVSLEEWMKIIGENKATIQKTSREDIESKEDLGSEVDATIHHPIRRSVSFGKSKNVRTPVNIELYYDKEEILEEIEESMPKEKLRRGTMLPKYQLDNSSEEFEK